MICRSCHRPILWARTLEGKRIPLDPDLEADGPMLLWAKPDDGEVVAVHRSKIVEVTQDEDAEHWPGRRTHFETCPHAAQHRKPRRR